MLGQNIELQHNLDSFISVLAVLSAKVTFFYLVFLGSWSKYNLSSQKRMKRLLSFRKMWSTQHRELSRVSKKLSRFIKRN